MISCGAFLLESADKSARIQYTADYYFFTNR